MYFLAFSHAYPELINDIPINNPETIIPINREHIASNPPNKLDKIGNKTIKKNGLYIALLA